MKNELLNGLKNMIEDFEQNEGGSINLITLIEDEGQDVTDELLIYLWDSVKNRKNVKRKQSINDIPLSIEVYVIQ